MKEFLEKSREESFLELLDESEEQFLKKNLGLMKYPRRTLERDAETNFW